eukprot:scaffold567_cov170-Amphora_coffeaeformis.AAC.14
MAAKSDGTQPTQSRASSNKSVDKGICATSASCKRFVRISSLCSAWGGVMIISRSNRRRSGTEMTSTRFVAATNKMMDA